MNCRHAAAFALVGWYLRLPPAGADGKRPNINAPLFYLASGRWCLSRFRGMPKKANIILKPIPVTSGGPQTTKCQRDEISCLYERTRSRRLHERACCGHFRGTNASIAVHLE